MSETYKECKDDICSEHETETILGNPIHNFQLLKRVTVTWSKVVASIDSRETNGKALAKNLKKLTRKVKLPSDGDLLSSAKSLLNLKQVYQLEPKNLVRGYLGGKLTGII